jgi:hypothetical protein
LFGELGTPRLVDEQPMVDQVASYITALCKRRYDPGIVIDHQRATPRAQEGGRTYLNMDPDE